MCQGLTPGPWPLRRNCSGTGALGLFQPNTDSNNFHQIQCFPTTEINSCKSVNLCKLFSLNTLSCNRSKKSKAPKVTQRCAGNEAYRTTYFHFIRNCNKNLRSYPERPKHITKMCYSLTVTIFTITLVVFRLQREEILRMLYQMKVNWNSNADWFMTSSLQNIIKQCQLYCSQYFQL